MLNESITLKNDISELSKLAVFLEEIGDKWDLGMKLALDVNLALEEIFVNIVSYGFDDGLEHSIGVDVKKGTGDFIVVITDDGKAFNPLLHEEGQKQVQKSLMDREIGGLGIHFVKTLMDKMEYERLDGRNVLTITKKI